MMLLAFARATHFLAISTTPRFFRWLPLLALLPAASLGAQTPNRYQNFQAAVYARAQEVAQMGDPDWVRPRFDLIQAHVKVGKIYLETHRDKTLVDEKTLERAIAFFKARGIEVAGGITFTISEPNRFETFCYSNPEHRAWVRQVVEHTARHFDEVILDDFFFTSCKSDVEIKARGNRSWTEYRLDLMQEAAQSLVLRPAKAVNPPSRSSSSTRTGTSTSRASASTSKRNPHYSTASTPARKRATPCAARSICSPISATRSFAISRT